MKLTVFCGSRFGNKESYKFIAQTLGKYMAQEENRTGLRWFILRDYGSD